MTMSTIRAFIGTLALLSLSSCRPPDMTGNAMEGHWERNPRLDRGEMPGQKPVGMDFKLLHDDRPEYIRNADNPDYDRTSGILEILGPSSDGSGGSKPLQVDIPSPPQEDTFDSYDIHNGSIRIPSDVINKDDPDFKQISDDAKDTQTQFGSKRALVEQRDYAREKSKELVDALNSKDVLDFSKEIDDRFKKLNDEIDRAIRDHNGKVDAITAQMPENENLPKVEGYEFKTPPNSPNGQKVRSAQEYVNYAKGIVSKNQGIAGERGRALVEYAQGAVITADGYYAEGRQAEGDFALEIGKTALDVGLGFVPLVGWGKDIFEAATGKNLVTGESLNGFERTMAAVGVLTAGYGSKLALVAKAGVVLTVLKTGTKEAGAIGEIASAMGKAEKFLDDAASIKRFGPLDAGPLHDIPTPSGSIADTFRSSSYYEVTTKSDAKMYRVYDANNDGQKLGSYWSRTKPAGPLQAQLDSALDPSWGNKATAWIEINVPAGSKVYEGAVSPVVLQSTGSKIPIGQLYGGGSQVYLHDIKIPDSWITSRGLF